MTLQDVMETLSQYRSTGILRAHIPGIALGEPAQVMIYVHDGKDQSIQLTGETSGRIFSTGEQVSRLIYDLVLSWTFTTDTLQSQPTPLPIPQERSPFAPQTLFHPNSLFGGSKPERVSFTDPHKFFSHVALSNPRLSHDYMQIYRLIDGQRSLQEIAATLQTSLAFVQDVTIILIQQGLVSNP